MYTGSSNPNVIERTLRNPIGPAPANGIATNPINTSTNERKPPATAARSSSPSIFGLCSTLVTFFRSASQALLQCLIELHWSNATCCIHRSKRCARLLIRHLTPGAPSLRVSQRKGGIAQFQMIDSYDAIPNPTRLAAAIMISIPAQSSRNGLLPTPAHSPSAKPIIPANKTYPLICSIQFT
jgi:hypothetical protein